MDEFVEIIKNNHYNSELSKKCDNLIYLINESILVHCSIYN